jgi:hypothetical protein
LVGVVGESRVEWDTEVVPILSEGERLKFVDFFDLLDEILALNGFVGFMDVVVALGPELERLLPKEYDEVLSPEVSRLGEIVGLVASLLSVAPINAE